MEKLIVPQGELLLSRYPVRKKETLRAWDAADEYLLHHLAEAGVGAEPSILILNDSFGCLAVALAQHQPTSLSDSFLSHCGARHNLVANQQPEAAVKMLASLDTPHGSFDQVLIKIPKSLALLEEQLHRIRPCITAETQIIGAGMTRGMHTSTLQLFEKIIGPTRTSLARKKARLAFCTPKLSITPPANPYPRHYQLEGTDYQVSNHANVFSREKLDIGTRFFIEHLPQADHYRHIIDLGCGNGLVGMVAAERNPSAQLTFVDESYMAVDSARSNFASQFPDRQAIFSVTDCLAGIEQNSADLILNNPPFHQHNAVSDHIAVQMFRESKGVLRQGGSLWVVGNRHLGYHRKLQSLFGNCQTVAGNQKFVILKADKR